MPQWTGKTFLVIAIAALVLAVALAYAYRGSHVDKVTPEAQTPPASSQPSP